MSSAQVRPIEGSTANSGAIAESGSFASHMKTLERKIPLRAKYENFIGGEWVAPAKGGYFDNISPTTGQVICKIARSGRGRRACHRCGARRRARVGPYPRRRARASTQ